MRFIGIAVQRAVLIVVVCLCGLSSFLLAQEKIPDQVLNWQQAAERSIEQKDYACAADQYQAIIRTFPDTTYALNAQTQIIKMLIERGDLSEADARTEVLFSDYSDQPDEFTRSIYPILNRYLYRKDYAKVIEIGNRALQLFPEHGNAFSARTVMAEALVRMKQVEQADVLVEDMFALYRDREDFVPFMHTVKSAYWKAGQREKSQVLCRRLLAGYPQHTLATRILGDWICGALVLGQENGVDEAIETLFARPEPAEDFLSVVARMQERYLAVNDFSRVLDLGSRALQKYPDHADTILLYRYLAQASAGMGDAEQACRWADELIARCNDDPDIANVMIETGHALRRYGLDSKAAEVYQKVFSKDSTGKDHLCALTGIAQSCIHLGEDARVNEIVNQIFTYYRQEEKCGYSVFVIGEEYFIKAEEAFRISDFEQTENNDRKAMAIWEINRSISEDPKHQALATHFTGWIYQRRREYEKAIGMYQEVFERWPSYEKTWQCALAACKCYEKLAGNGILPDQKANNCIMKWYQRLLQNPTSCPASIQQQVRIWVKQYEQDKSDGLRYQQILQ